MGKALDGQVAIITGGGRGQGRADAVALATLGARIVLCDVPAALASVRYELGTAEDLDLTVSLVKEAGSEAIAVPADVRDPVAVARVADAALAAFGQIDILVANAGIVSTGKVRELPLSDEILGRRFAAHHPIPRPWIYPEDVAREVVHLVTEPGNITGTVIEIGLGQSARMH